jgi:cytochrome c oxidase cbb3-type subunit 3
MHARSAILFPALVAALALAACGKTPRDDALAFAATPTPKAPVGPRPGPKDAAPPADGPYANDAVAINEGRTLFVRFNCSGCHGGRGGGGMGPSLRDPVWIYGGSDAAIFDSIAQGRAHGMPAWGTKLPEDQVWKLVAYVRSLRTPAEPDAPR